MERSHKWLRAASTAVLGGFCALPVLAQLTAPGSAEARTLAAAEWSAVSAHLTMVWTAIGAGVSLCALVALIFTLKVNRDAVKAAQSSATAASNAVTTAKQIFDIESRAWVSLECSVDGSAFIPDFTHEKFELAVRLKLTNHGASPATAAALVHWVGTGPVTETWLQEFGKGSRQYPASAGYTIFPNATKLVDLTVKLPRTAITMTVPTANERFVPWVSVCVTYHTGAEIHQTRLACPLYKDSPTGPVEFVHGDLTASVPVILLTSKEFVIAD